MLLQGLLQNVYLVFENSVEEVLSKKGCLQGQGGKCRAVHLQEATVVLLCGHQQAPWPLIASPASQSVQRWTCTNLSSSVACGTTYLHAHKSCVTTWESAADPAAHI